MPGDLHGDDGFCEGAQAGDWDARYREQAGARWSGRPNGRLLVEVSGLAPGRALDVGCREGADPIWLAGARLDGHGRRGWMVTAIDISDVAVGRARAAGARAGAAVKWICGDALQTAFPTGSFDLVSLQYPALLKAAGEVAVRALLDTVRPGGLHRCPLPPHVARWRLHGRARCGRAAHRPTTGQRAYRRRRPARPAPLTADQPEAVRPGPHDGRPCTIAAEAAAMNL